jgi:hypothetical protein
LIHSTSVATATRSQRVSIPTLKSSHMAPESIPELRSRSDRDQRQMHTVARTINKKGVSRPRSNVPALRARYQSGRARLTKRRRSQLAPAVRGAQTASAN